MSFLGIFLLLQSLCLYFFVISFLVTVCFIWVRQSAFVYTMLHLLVCSYLNLLYSFVSDCPGISARVFVIYTNCLKKFPCCPGLKQSSISQLSCFAFSKDQKVHFHPIKRAIVLMCARIILIHVDLCQV